MAAGQRHDQHGAGGGSEDFAARAACPRVSFVMPGYNGMPYLPLALDSILAQTFRDFELIVVDDASTDATPEVLAEYARKDNRVRILTNPQNLGVAGTLNIGLNAARGELIAVMDDDDISLPERFQRQVEFLDSHPDHVLVGTYFQIIDAKGRVQKTERLPTEHWELEWCAHFWNPMGHPTAMFRARPVHEAGLRYDGQYRAASDADFLVRILAYGKAANLPVPLVQYRMHDQNVSTRLSEVQRHEACDIRLVNLVKWYPQVVGNEKPLKDLFHLLLSRRRAEDARVSQAAEAMLSIESDFLRSRQVSGRQKRRIHGLAARWLAWAVAGSGSARDILELFWCARSYRIQFLRLAAEFLWLRAIDCAARQSSRLQRL